MKNYISLIIVLIFSAQSFGAGPAGEIVSLNCSYAIASALKFIEEKDIKTNVTVESGEFICVTPNEKEIYVRLQTPNLKPSDNKHMFFVNAKTYEIIRHAYGR